MKKLIYNIIKSLTDFYWNYTYVQYKTRYKIPSDFKFNGHHVHLYGDGKLIIGKRSYIGHSSQIQISKGYSVEIGSNCRIASGVKIYTGTNESDQDFSADQLKKKFGSITISDNVWIGANVFITPGVTIGENSIVGANSVVTRDLPSWSICGGIPAKVIRKKTVHA